MVNAPTLLIFAGKSGDVVEVPGFCPKIISG
jgi:hypothetical protein